MARVCDLFGPVIVFLVPLLNLAPNLVPVLVHFYIAKLVQKRNNEGRVWPRGPNQGGRTTTEDV